MKVVSPLGERRATEMIPKSRAQGTKRTAVVMANGWPAMHTMAQIMRDRLEQEHGYSTAMFPYDTSEETAADKLDLATRDAGFIIAGAAT